MTQIAALALDSLPPEALKADLDFDLMAIDYADSQRLRTCLGTQLSDESLDRLRRSRRLRYRLSAMLLQRFKLERCRLQSLPEDDRRLLLSEPAEIVRVARLAGTVWIGGYLMTIVTTEELRPVLDGLGRDAYDFALANLELSAGPGAEVDPDSIDTTVEWLGLRCLVAWSAGRHPAAIFGRLRLMFPCCEAIDRPPSPHEQMFGPRIIQRVIEEKLEDE